MVRFLKMHKNVVLPQYSTTQAACFDIRAYCPSLDNCPSIMLHKDLDDFYSTKPKDTIIIPSRGIRIIPTGLKLKIPKGYSIRLHPRSGLSTKGITLGNCEGIIDSDYMDEIKVILVNQSFNSFPINHLDRICQAELVFSPQYEILEIDEVEFLDRELSNRTGGLGSTGVS